MHGRFYPSVMKAPIVLVTQYISILLMIIKMAKINALSIKSE
jgi:hypothetical protein